jgi:hypothetical protein
MKKRYLYSLLFGMPGFVFAVVISFMSFGFLAGVLWIYVFGDNPWPSLIEKTLPALFALVFLTLWITTIIVGFVVGKRLENDPVLNKKHVLVSIGVTIIPILFIFLYQVCVGNIGPKSEGERCSDFCGQRGYPASSMPPEDSGERSCSCLDHSGLEIIKVPLDRIDPVK